MKSVIKHVDNLTTLKIGLTKEELQKIIDGTPFEFKFDKFHHHEYRLVVKKI